MHLLQVDHNSFSMACHMRVLCPSMRDDMLNKPKIDGSPVAGIPDYPRMD